MFDEENLFESNDDEFLKKHRQSKSNDSSPNYLNDLIGRKLSNSPEMAQQWSNLLATGILVPEWVQLFCSASKIAESTSTHAARLAPNRALISIVDEMTGGEVTRRSKMFEFERLFVVVHTNIFLFNSIREKIINSENAPTTDSVEIENLTAVYLEILLWSLEYLKRDYIECCTQYNYSINENLMNFGIVENADLAYCSGFGYPAYLNHYVIGDVSDITNSYNNYHDYVASLIERGCFTGEKLVMEPS